MVTQTETNKRLNSLTILTTKTQFKLGDFFCTNLRLRQCLYWEISPGFVTQVYGRSAHQLGGDGLVQAVVSAGFLRPDDHAPVARGGSFSSVASVRFDLTGTAVCAGHKRAGVSRGFSQPRLDRTRNVVFQQL